MKHLRVDELTPDELRKIVDAPNRRCPTGARNRAFLAVLYRGGLRCIEALNLAPEDVDFTRGLIEVRTSKTASGLRSAAIDDGGLERLRDWYVWRERVGLGAGSHLFVTLDGGAPISASYVRAMIPRCARRAGIAKRVHAHALRHAHACELHAEGVPLASITRQLGHANVSTTDVYLRRHAIERARIEGVRRRAW